MLENGANPNTVNRYNRRSCLSNAVILGRTAIADRLPRHGAVDEPLGAADEFRSRCGRAMKRLLEDHPELVRLPELLREAANYGLACVLWLVDRGFDINGRTECGIPSRGENLRAVAYLPVSSSARRWAS